MVLLLLRWRTRDVRRVKALLRMAADAIMRQPVCGF